MGKDIKIALIIEAIVLLFYFINLNPVYYFTGQIDIAKQGISLFSIILISLVLSIPLWIKAYELGKEYMARQRNPSAELI